MSATKQAELNRIKKLIEDLIYEYNEKSSAADFDTRLALTVGDVEDDEGEDEDGWNNSGCSWATSDSCSY